MCMGGSHRKLPSFLGGRKRAQFAPRLIGRQLIPNLRNFAVPIAGEEQRGCPFSFMDRINAEIWAEVMTVYLVPR